MANAASASAGLHKITGPSRKSYRRDEMICRPRPAPRFAAFPVIALMK